MPSFLVFDESNGPGTFLATEDVANGAARRLAAENIQRAIQLARAAKSKPGEPDRFRSLVARLNISVLKVASLPRDVLKGLETLNPTTMPADGVGDRLCPDRRRTDPKLLTTRDAVRSSHRGYRSTTRKRADVGEMCRRSRAARTRASDCTGPSIVSAATRARSLVAVAPDERYLKLSMPGTMITIGGVRAAGDEPRGNDGFPS